MAQASGVWPPRPHPLERQHILLMYVALVNSSSYSTRQATVEADYRLFVQSCNYLLCLRSSSEVRLLFRNYPVALECLFTDYTPEVVPLCFMFRLLELAGIANFDNATQPLLPGFDAENGDISRISALPSALTDDAIAVFERYRQPLQAAIGESTYLTQLMVLMQSAETSDQRCGLFSQTICELSQLCGFRAVLVSNTEIHLDIQLFRVRFMALFNIEDSSISRDIAVQIFGGEVASYFCKMYRTWLENHALAIGPTEWSQRLVKRVLGSLPHNLSLQKFAETYTGQIAAPYVKESLSAQHPNLARPEPPSPKRTRLDSSVISTSIQADQTEEARAELAEATPLERPEDQRRPIKLRPNLRPSMGPHSTVAPENSSSMHTLENDLEHRDTSGTRPDSRPGTDEFSFSQPPDGLEDLDDFEHLEDLEESTGGSASDDGDTRSSSESPSNLRKELPLLPIEDVGLMDTHKLPRLTKMYRRHLYLAKRFEKRIPSLSEDYHLFSETCLRLVQLKRHPQALNMVVEEDDLMSINRVIPGMLPGGAHVVFLAYIMRRAGVANFSDPKVPVFQYLNAKTGCISNETYPSEMLAGQTMLDIKRRFVALLRQAPGYNHIFLDRMSFQRATPVSRMIQRVSTLCALDFSESVTVTGMQFYWSLLQDRIIKLFCSKPSADFRAVASQLYGEEVIQEIFLRHACLRPTLSASVRELQQRAEPRSHEFATAGSSAIEALGEDSESQESADTFDTIPLWMACLYAEALDRAELDGKDQLTLIRGNFEQFLHSCCVINRLRRDWNNIGGLLTDPSFIRHGGPMPAAAAEELALVLSCYLLHAAGFAKLNDLSVPMFNMESATGFVRAEHDNPTTLGLISAEGRQLVDSYLDAGMIRDTPVVIGVRRAITPAYISRLKSVGVTAARLADFHGFKLSANDGTLRDHIKLLHARILTALHTDRPGPISMDIGQIYGTEVFAYVFDKYKHEMSKHEHTVADVVLSQLASAQTTSP